MKLPRTHDPHRVERAPAPGLRRRHFWLLGTWPGLAALPACTSAPKPEHYRHEVPALDLRRYFDGKLTAHGIFRDRSGTVVRRFVVDMSGQWSGAPGAEQGVLDERFTYLDRERAGQTERRVWHLRRLPGNGAVAQYEGTADDVVGTARGETAGNAFHWGYTLRLPVDGRVVEVDLDDWMFLVDERTMLNHAGMRKWGVHLGDVLITFTRAP